jgi:hypothetical protein
MKKNILTISILLAALSAGTSSTAFAADAVEYNYTSADDVPLCLKDAPQILRSLNASTPANQAQEDMPLIFPRSSNKTQLEQLLEDVNNSPETGMLQWMHNDTDKPFSGTMSSEPDELLIFPRTSNETWADWLFSGKGTPDPYDFYQPDGSESISNTDKPFSATMSLEPDELLIFPRTSDETWADWIYSGKGTPDPYDFYQDNGTDSSKIRDRAIKNAAIAGSEAGLQGLK